MANDQNTLYCHVDATCGYFEWVDPPMCQRGREVLPKMVTKMNKLEKELARSRRREKMFCKALFGTWAGFCTMEELLLAIMFQPNHAGLEQERSSREKEEKFLSESKSSKLDLRGLNRWIRVLRFES
ncbi:hypothetical protein HYC85_015718 [Camellia sinensis]|uniref:Uncharacterized protein n=1 Tax=Camellia sinensis TaxID=4442 RepID=A0A7J7GXU8_CAMSI|nr:hypothetical protein HYC85_015718 [Camellia sinensis]